MNHVIDQSCDAGFATLRTLMEKYPTLRTFAKTANLDSNEFEKLSSDSFAWPAERKFPIHTPQHTALSVGYSKVAKEVPAGVASMLEKAAEIHGVSSELFEAAQQEKVAAEEDYLLPERKRFKVTSPEDVSLAEEAYRMKYAQLSVEDRAEAGNNLVKYAKKHEVPLHSSTKKLAGLTLTDTATFKDWMGARAEAALQAKSPLASAFQKLAEEFTNVEPYVYDRNDQFKLASTVSHLDKEAGLTQHYGRKLLTPIETVFNTDIPRDAFVKVGSSLANRGMLQQMPLSFWKDALGDDIAKEIAPGGEVDPDMLEQIIPTLPADLKAALETQLAAYNR